ncbi:MAG: LysR family transcriptional regulator [Gammaproteobacteria bacterium]
MDISALKAFIAVAETGSFSRAAEALFLTQPAISKRIRSLENELNTKLYDRIGRTVALTQAGNTLLPRAKKILLDLDDSIRSIHNLNESVTGKLRFATSHHIGLHRLPPALRTFSQQYPEVQLGISFMDSENACQLVETGALELAIVTLPLTPLPGLKTQLIWEDPLSVTVLKSHPLARNKTLQLTDLADHRAILPSPNTFTRQIVDGAFEKLHLKLDVYLSTNYLETIKMLVSIGIGWSVLPETMIDKNIVSLKVKEIGLKRSLGIVYHRERSLSNAARQFIAGLT